VRLSTKLKDTTLAEGQGSEIAVSVTNVDDKDGQPMTLAIVRSPTITLPHSCRRTSAST
jgi:hypothetical protein